jgi:hypothetical protein
MRFLKYTFFFAAVGCSGSTVPSPSAPETKAGVAAASAQGATQGDPCAKYGWYGDGECDTFCATTDTDCVPDNSGSPIFCAAFIEASDGRCSRPDRDPCRFQDPDCSASCGGTGHRGDCALVAELPDGKCSRPSSDVCRFQDPDCVPTDPGSVNCNLNEIACQTFAPVVCPAGQVPSVVNRCYGPCVDPKTCAPPPPVFDGGVVCPAILLPRDGVCQSPECGDPDCTTPEGGTVCAQYIEVSDGVCRRPADDPCIFQDPDCAKK